jgi:hypothetical protein
LEADALEEHDELELEKEDRVDGRPAAALIAAARELAHGAEVQLGSQLPIEVIARHQGLERDHDRALATTRLQGTKHRPPHPRR